MLTSFNTQLRWGYALSVFCQLSGLAWIDVTGADAVRVLNNLCTADLKRLELGRGVEAFVTEVRGRTLGHLCVYRLADRLRLLGAPGQASGVVAHVDRYVIREDAAPQAVGAEWASFWLSSADAAPGREGSAENGLPTAAAPELASGEIHWGPVRADVYQVPWTSDRDHVAVVAPEDAPALEQALRQSGWQTSNEADFHRRRIEHHFPWFGIDLDESNLPQEADRDRWAISFTKGCYLGQETVARLDALGQVQKKLLRWRLQTPQPPAAGTELRSGDRVVGRITSASGPTESGEIIALGFGRRSHFDAGSEAECDGVRATVLADE